MHTWSRRAVRHNLQLRYYSVMAEAGRDSEDTIPPMELQDSLYSLYSEMPAGAEAAQPYPRSPKPLRKIVAGGKHSKEVLTAHLETLQAERSRAEAHLQSLKKRSNDLTRSVEAMKAQTSEHYDSMRRVLQKDERLTLDHLEQERQQANARLTELLRHWKQHLAQVQKDISELHHALEQSNGSHDCSVDLSGRRKKEAAEEGIKMNEERFQKLLKILHNISNDLQAELQRKDLLLDSSSVEIDKHTCHRQIMLSAGGRKLCLTNEPKAVPSPEQPLRFDRVYCALGSAPFSSGRHYWEVEVGCCPAWAVGITYGCLERKGSEKGCKLGRNHHSWCLELRDGALLAWHNERHSVCRSPGTEALRRVGVLLEYEKGRVALYDATSARLLQEFSSTAMPASNRMRHRFTEPLFPAFRFLKPEGGHAGPNHMDICTPRV